MEENNTSELQYVSENNQIKESTIVSKKAMQQVADTIYFEFQRNWKKTILLYLVVGIIFILTLIVEEINLSKQIPLGTSNDFLASELSFLSDFLIISSVAYGGSCISVDFERQTGNLLFPKISRSRLLLGRIIALFIMNASTVIVWYILSGIYLGIHFNWQIPNGFWSSLGFAIFYSFSTLSFVVFISSLLKSVSGTMIISIIMLLIGFQMVLGLLALTTIEPVFLLTYYNKIIIAIIQMPDSRFIDIKINIPGVISITERTWITPDIPTAIIGMALYSLILLGISFIVFQRRQQNS
jgi:ABC-type transport system involved in multi-copper enzyme maturation permease subunit